MRTELMLMARYDGLPVVPLDRVAADFFAHLTPDRLLTLISRGEIKLPLVRAANSQKATKGVALEDLAAYLDGQIAAARKEFQDIHGKPFAV